MDDVLICKGSPGVQGSPGPEGSLSLWSRSSFKSTDFLEQGLNPTLKHCLNSIRIYFPAGLGHANFPNSLTLTFSADAIINGLDKTLGQFVSDPHRVVITDDPLVIYKNDLFNDANNFNMMSALYHHIYPEDKINEVELKRKFAFEQCLDSSSGLCYNKFSKLRQVFDVNSIKPLPQFLKIIFMEDELNLHLTEIIDVIEKCYR